MTGYLLEGYWTILVAIPTIGLLYLLGRRRSELQGASVLLVGSTLLAVVGVMIKLSFTLMLLGCVGALASWDLSHFFHTMQDAESHLDVNLLKRAHDQSLVVAIGGGVFLTLAAANLAFDLPFIVVLLLCATAIGGVYFGIRAFLRSEH